MTKKAGLLINEARKIPERDRWQIETSLTKRLCEGVDVATVLAKIESAIQNYWAEVEAEQQRQKPSEIKRQLSRVADCTVRFPEYARELSAALENLGPDAGEVLRLNWEKLHARRPKRRRAEPYLTLDDVKDRIALDDLQHRLRGAEILDDLRKRVKELRQAALDFEPRSRPRQDAAGVLINILALIYECATGKWPGRTWDEYRGRDRHPYFEACFRAAGMSTKDSIKKLAMVRPILEAGKAQRTPRSKIAKQSRQSRH